jgi:hypothetical protein
MPHDHDAAPTCASESDPRRRQRAWRFLVAACLAGVACAGGLAAVPLTAAADAVVANGGFESPVVPDITGIEAPASIGGWQVEHGRVSLAPSSAWAPAEGAQSIAFDGGFAARTSISQVVAVEPGRRYRLSLSHADGPVPPGGYVGCGQIDGLVMPLEVFWDGVRVGDIQWGGGRLTDDWQQFATVVGASGPQATLQLASERGEVSDCGMTIDDVSLSEPTAAQTATSIASSSDRAVIGQPVTFTATVIGGDPEEIPEGGVQFEVDGSAAGASVPVDGSGTAKAIMADLPAGVHNVRALFTPAEGTSFEPSVSPPVAVSVAKGDTTTSVTISPDPAVAGQDATYTATIRAVPPSVGVPSGSVQFRDDDGSLIGESQPLDATGEAGVTVASDAGSYVIHATYSGDGAFSPSEGTAPQTVDKATTVTSLSSTPNPVAPGGEVEFTASVAVQEPGDSELFGSLQFTLDGAPFGSSIPLMGDDGVIVTAKAPDSPATSQVGVSYSGDWNTKPSSASLTQVVASPAAPPSGTPTPTPTPTSTPVVTTTADLHRMVAKLRDRLRKRGLAGLTGVKEPFAATQPGVLTQAVYSPKAPKKATSAAPGSSRAAKNLLIAQGRLAFDRPRTGTLKLRSTAKGRKRIRHARRLHLTIVTRFTPTAGTPVIAVDRMTVRRKPASSSGRSVDGRAASWGRLVDVTRFVDRAGRGVAARRPVRGNVRRPWNSPSKKMSGSLVGER